jgi:ATP-dependent exoDNAse (exonuclease V) beta subunit
MTTPASFQVESTALLPGVTLIEASAGTGKTFTIAGLFLRLILETKLSVDEILVVTYTEAATEELRGRIRQTLAFHCWFEFQSISSIAHRATSRPNVERPRTVGASLA